MCSFGSCQTRFELLSQFRKVRNAFECFVHLADRCCRLKEDQAHFLWDSTSDAMIFRVCLCMIQIVICQSDNVLTTPRLFLEYHNNTFFLTR